MVCVPADTHTDILAAEIDSPYNIATGEHNYMPTHLLAYNFHYAIYPLQFYTHPMPVPPTLAITLSVVVSGCVC